MYRRYHCPCGHLPHARLRHTPPRRRHTSDESLDCSEYSASESESCSGSEDSNVSDCTSNRGGNECILNVIILRYCRNKVVQQRERDIDRHEIIAKERIRISEARKKSYLTAKIKAKIFRLFPEYNGSFRYLPILGCEVEELLNCGGNGRRCRHPTEPKIYIRLTKPLKKNHSPCPRRRVSNNGRLHGNRRLQYRHQHVQNHQRSPSVRCCNSQPVHNHHAQFENDRRNLFLGLWWVKLIILESSDGDRSECDEDDEELVRSDEILLETRLLMNFGEDLCRVLHSKMRSAMCILLPGYKGGFNFLPGYKEILDHTQSIVRGLLECSEEQIRVRDLPPIPRIYIRLKVPLEEC